MLQNTTATCVMSAHTSPVAKRARRDAPPVPLMCRGTGGRYKDVASVVTAGSAGLLLVRFSDNTQLADADGTPLPVAKKDLVFFPPQQPPDAKRQLGDLAGALLRFDALSCRASLCRTHTHTHAHNLPLSLAVFVCGFLVSTVLASSIPPRSG